MMVLYVVIGTQTYLTQLEGLDTSERTAAEKIPQKLAENPFVGKPLRYPFLREKKIREKRIYYLVYDDLSCNKW